MLYFLFIAGLYWSGWDHWLALGQAALGLILILMLARRYPLLAVTIPVVSRWTVHTGDKGHPEFLPPTRPGRSNAPAHVRHQRTVATIEVGRRPAARPFDPLTDGGRRAARSSSGRPPPGIEPGGGAPGS